MFGISTTYVRQALFPSRRILALSPHFHSLQAQEGVLRRSRSKPRAPDGSIARASPPIEQRLARQIIHLRSIQTTNKDRYKYTDLGKKYGKLPFLQ